MRLHYDKSLTFNHRVASRLGESAHEASARPAQSSRGANTRSAPLRRCLHYLQPLDSCGAAASHGRGELTLRYYKSHEPPRGTSKGLLLQEEVPGTMGSGRGVRGPWGTHYIKSRRAVQHSSTLLHLDTLAQSRFPNACATEKLPPAATFLPETTSNLVVLVPSLSIASPALLPQHHLHSLCCDISMATQPLYHRLEHNPSSVHLTIAVFRRFAALCPSPPVVSCGINKAPDLCDPAPSLLPRPHVSALRHRKKSSVPHVFPLPSLHHYSILVLSLFSPFLLSLSLVLFSPSPLCTPSRPPHCSGGPEERIPAGQAARRELGRSPEVLGVIHCRGAREGTTSRRNGGRKPGRTSVVIDEMTGRRWQLLLSAGTSDEGLPPPPRPPGEEKKIEHAEPPREKLDLIHGPHQSQAQENELAQWEKQDRIRPCALLSTEDVLISSSYLLSGFQRNLLPYPGYHFDGLPSTFRCPFQNQGQPCAISSL
ncbi:hypothetical protein C7M84_015544 [Penaeus vannamei]|uniref:Uncharacterized protein n=1 Tax=Penaeus vannamei TaxID=6689 RepID=A0A423SQE0_PENVA|nr:hypothetical protein C7M84_015544 [Penaeus vannamei]